MKRLLVLYDKDIKDKGRDMYLKQIKKHIPEALIRDINDSESAEDAEKILLLRPVKSDIESYYYFYFKQRPDLDIEHAWANRLTITAEAIFKVLNRKLEGVRGKNILILNQSRVLGISLADVLIRMGANVFSCNSSMTDIQTIAYFVKFDAIVTATGNKEFKIPERITESIDVKIDLSDDLEDRNKIISVPTIEVLRERLKNE